MDGFTPTATPTALPDPLRDAEAMLRLATDQLADAERTLREIADADPIPPAGVTYRDRTMVWRNNVRACLTRLRGG